MKEIYIGLGDFKVLQRFLDLDAIQPSKYKGIVCPLRGGFYLSDYLSRKYNIPLNYVNISSYTNDNKQREIKINGFDKISSGHFLIVDDIYDTGNTVKHIKEIVYPENTFDVCCLVNKQRDADIIYAKYVEPGVWVEFFWEGI